MRAKISDVHHGSALHAEWLDHPDFALFAPQALAEARAILAETEPGTESPKRLISEAYGFLPDGIHFSARYMSQRTLTHGTMISEGQAALAETLTAFVALDLDS